MPAVGIFRLHLAGLGRPQLLQRAAGLLNPIVAGPGVAPRTSFRCRARSSVLPPVCRRERVSPIRTWHSWQSVGPSPEDFLSHPTRIRQRADLLPLALHHQGPLRMGVDMSQPCRIAKPTIRHDPGGWQPPAPPRQDRPGPIQHNLQLRPLVAARAVGTHGVWGGR